MQAVLQTQGYVKGQVLYMALELGQRKWKLGFSDGTKLRCQTVTGGDVAAVLREIATAKTKFKLAASARVVSCYEAGRDGFWLHRWLASQGIENEVVDSASIERSRRARQAKTDRLDAESLLRLLRRYHGGERKALRVVRVPSEAEEDQRRRHRERERLVKERTQHSNRLQGLLMAQGIRLKVRATFAAEVEQVRRWDGTELPPELKAEVVREWERYQIVNKQIQELEALQQQRVVQAQAGALQQIQQLLQLRAVGPQSSWLLVMEVCGWRGIKNRRELAALAGLTPTPDDSGERRREQGISKAGNRRVRAVMVELAWLWVYYQSQSALSQEFLRRYAQGGSRQRRIGIVALARKLLIALWQYLETGAVPAGAVLKAA